MDIEKKQKIDRKNEKTSRNNETKTTEIDENNNFETKNMAIIEHEMMKSNTNKSRVNKILSFLSLFLLMDR